MSQNSGKICQVYSKITVKESDKKYQLKALKNTSKTEFSKATKR